MQPAMPLEGHLCGAIQECIFEGYGCMATNNNRREALMASMTQQDIVLPVSSLVQALTSRGLAPGILIGVSIAMILISLLMLLRMPHRQRQP